MSCKKESPPLGNTPPFDESLSSEQIKPAAEPLKQVAEPNQPVPEPNQLPAGPVSVKFKWTHPRSDERLSQRRRMVRVIRDLYGFNDPNVLQAMENVPRHWFVTAREQNLAYADSALPIGYGQTISQPFIVAYMTKLLELNPTKKVLEVGTGSGYQAAVLSEFTPYVYTIEIIEPLGRETAELLRRRGYTTIETKIGDGYLGWEEKGPFDAIIVTCAPDHIPPPLIEQLKPGGKMCIPVGEPGGIQSLRLLRKDQSGRTGSQSLMLVQFVPLIRKK